jgi:hypothetical protein
VTGKRNAVRIKTGQSVDHSDPVLRVEPTSSLTAGRNPEASPSLSQRKSGREREGGPLALSGGAADAMPADAVKPVALTSEELDRIRDFFLQLDRWDRESNDASVM